MDKEYFTESDKSPFYISRRIVYGNMIMDIIFPPFISLILSIDYCIKGNYIISTLSTLFCLFVLYGFPELLNSYSILYWKILKIKVIRHYYPLISLLKVVLLLSCAIWGFQKTISLFNHILN